MESLIGLPLASGLHLLKVWSAIDPKSTTAGLSYLKTVSPFLSASRYQAFAYEMSIVDNMASFQRFFPFSFTAHVRSVAAVQRG